MTPLGSFLFFGPFLYVLLYLFVERGFNQHALIQKVLKVFTMGAGLSLAVYARTLPMEVVVQMPGRAGQSNNGVPAAIFFVIVGFAIAALPWYSRFIRFSHRDERERD